MTTRALLVRSDVATTTFLCVLAVLAYFGHSLVMLASISGMTVAFWIARHRSIKERIAACAVGALAGGLLAEVIHVIHHRLQDGTPEHGGFWISAVLVSLINAAAVVPALWVDDRRRTRQSPKS